jgi:hypothetical protein
MIKQIAWNTFKNTGNIDTFMELKQVIDVEENIKADEDETNQNKWSSNSRENGRRL